MRNSAFSWVRYFSWILSNMSKLEKTYLFLSRSELLLKMRIFILEKLRIFKFHHNWAQMRSFSSRKSDGQNHNSNSATKNGSKCTSETDANADLQHLPAENFFDITIAHFFFNFWKPAEMPIVVHWTPTDVFSVKKSNH